MGSSRFHRLGGVLAVVLVGTLLVPGLTSGAVAAEQVPALSPRVIAAALHAPATTVRTDGALTVGAITIDDRLASLVGPDAQLYRVTIDGRYVPRALRYVVRAGSTPVAYGFPRRDERALLAVTTDPAVLSQPITVRYGSSPAAGPAIVPATTPMPEGSVSLGDATPGPYDVTRTEYDLGDRVYQPPGLGGRVELVADVHFPTDLTAGPFPIVLFLHGNHSSCYKGNRSGYEWPCRPGWTPIPNYEGYDYIAKRLASYGYVVVSVSGNGVNVLGNYVDDTGMQQRGYLLEKHLDLWKTWSTVGGDPFGTTFVGAIDLSQVGVMGHSRGGEGAVWQVLLDRERPDPYGIDAVLPLAPVDFTRPTINDVPLGVMLPYCDGDVSDLQGVHFFDDSRYAVPGDPDPKATVTVFGANHNFFNTVWSPSSGIPGSFDDGWNCEGRLTERQQRRVGIAYVVSFFRRYVGTDPQRGTIWTGEKTPGTIAPATTAVTYLAPDDPAARMDVDRFTQPRDLARTEPGGEVTPTQIGTYAWCSNVYDLPCVPGDLSWMDIHLSWSWFGPVGPGLQEGIVGWSGAAEGNAALDLDLAGTTDVTGYDFVGFRTVPNPGYSANSGTDYQDLSLVLHDADGNEASLGASDVGNDVLKYPLQQRRRYAEGHIIMNQIRFPLDAFVGVDLTRITSVELRFDRVARGVIDVSDMAFWAGEAG